MKNINPVAKAAFAFKKSGVPFIHGNIKGRERLVASFNIHGVKVSIYFDEMPNTTALRIIIKGLLAEDDTVSTREAISAACKTLNTKYVRFILNNYGYIQVVYDKKFIHENRKLGEFYLNLLHSILLSLNENMGSFYKVLCNSRKAS